MSAHLYTWQFWQAVLSVFWQKSRVNITRSFHRRFYSCTGIIWTDEGVTCVTTWTPCLDRCIRLQSHHRSRSEGRPNAPWNSTYSFISLTLPRCISVTPSTVSYRNVLTSFARRHNLIYQKNDTLFLLYRVQHDFETHMQDLLGCISIATSTCILIKLL